MKRTIYIIIALALVVLVVAMTRGEETGSADRAAVTGRVTSVDLEQIAADGPYVISVEDEDGLSYAIHIPSMGLPLCAARDNIASPSELAVGMTVEVVGTMTATGEIVPCESAEHYLRIKR